MILKHRDAELLRFAWVGDTRVRIVSVNDAARRLLPHLEVSARSAENDFYAIRNYLRDKHPALFRNWLGFPYELTEATLDKLAALEKFRFKKHRHYNWTDERRRVLSAFLQKRANDIRRFGRDVDEKYKQSLVCASIFTQENVGVKSEQKVALLILRNSAVTQAEIANQLGMTQRHVERIIAVLKKKAGLKRRGSDKVGEWYFENL